MRPSEKRWHEHRQQLASGLSLLILLGFLGMWLLSYRYYTSVGLDLAWGTAPSITVGHLRLRWPGDGSLRLGYGQLTVAEAATPEIDPAAALFQPPRRETSHSIWNRLGFWFISHWPDPEYQERWLGIPAWLPLPLLYFTYRRLRPPT